MSLSEEVQKHIKVNYLEPAKRSGQEMIRVRAGDFYGCIRAENPVLLADAIHLASAAEARSDLFLTNDQRLQRLNISGIKFIAGLDGTIFCIAEAGRCAPAT
jgi:hypothetical protein